MKAEERARGAFEAALPPTLDIFTWLAEVTAGEADAVDGPAAPSPPLLLPQTPTQKKATSRRAQLVAKKQGWASITFPLHQLSSGASPSEEAETAARKAGEEAARLALAEEEETGEEETMGEGEAELTVEATVVLSPLVHSLVCKSPHLPFAKRHRWMQKGVRTPMKTPTVVPPSSAEAANESQESEQPNLVPHPQLDPGSLAHKGALQIGETPQLVRGKTPVLQTPQTVKLNFGARQLVSASPASARFQSPASPILAAATPSLSARPHAAQASASSKAVKTTGGAVSRSVHHGLRGTPKPDFNLNHDPRKHDDALSKKAKLLADRTEASKTAHNERMERVKAQREAQEQERQAAMKAKMEKWEAATAKPKPAPVVRKGTPAKPVPAHKSSADARKAKLAGKPLLKQRMELRKRAEDKRREAEQAELAARKAEEDKRQRQRLRPADSKKKPPPAAVRSPDPSPARVLRPAKFVKNDDPQQPTTSSQPRHVPPHTCLL